RLLYWVEGRFTRAAGITPRRKRSKPGRRSGSARRSDRRCGGRSRANAPGRSAAADLRTPASAPMQDRTSSSTPRTRGVSGSLHELEEFRRRVDHEHVGTSTETGAIGLETAIEVEELGTLAEGSRIDGRRLGITLALDLLRVAIGFGEQHLALSIGIRADLLAFG